MFKKIAVIFIALFLFANSAYALRIVSLAPSVTEIIFELGAGDYVVGDTLFSNYPEKAKHLPKVGSYIRPNLEKIISLKPDYVIGITEGTSISIKHKLDKLGIKNVFYNAKSVKDITFMIKDIASIVNKNPNKIIKKINKIYEKKFKPKYTGIMLVSVKPLIAATSSTFINDILECGGIDNIVKSSINAEFITISKEFIIKTQPDYIILSLGLKNQIEIMKSLMKEFHIKSRLIVVNPDIYNRPSCRITKACLDLRKRILR